MILRAIYEVMVKIDVLASVVDLIKLDVCSKKLTSSWKCCELPDCVLRIAHRMGMAGKSDRHDVKHIPYIERANVPAASEEGGLWDVVSLQASIGKAPLPLVNHSCFLV